MGATMACKEYEALERDFVGIRTKQTSLLLKGELTSELEEQLSRQELTALFRLIDHKTEHGCQNS